MASDAPGTTVLPPPGTAPETRHLIEGPAYFCGVRQEVRVEVWEWTPPCWRCGNAYRWPERAASHGYRYMRPERTDA